MGIVSIIAPNNPGLVEEEFEYQDLEELSALITSESWAPAIFENRKRSVANFSRTDLLVLDVDDGCTLESALELFKNYKSIIATSRNHQKEKNGKVVDRFRVVLFLDSPITDDPTYKATWEAAKRRYPFIDDAAKDSARMFYASPNIVKINAQGTLFPVSMAKIDQPLFRAGSEKSGQTVILNGNLDLGDGARSAAKGDLWKSTLDFLVNGAAAGTRHNRLVQAVGNMREQGYSKPEVIEKIQSMIDAGGSWTQPHLSPVDLKTIDRMFERDPKYSYRPKEDTDTPSILVNASELLDEAFEYLSDKDKVKGEPTGIDGLDDLLGGGFRTGELTVLMAQAKTGKNTLYHYLIYKHLERGIPFGYASRELNPATEVIPNLLSIGMKSNAWINNIDERFKERARQIMSPWSLYFAPGYGHFPTEQLETWFRGLKDLGVNHFLFDHFHYALQGEDYEATAVLIKKLKSITKELDIHLSLIVQPRSLREGEQLSLATLRGGAAIGQALDNLLILERVKGETNISKLTLEVARHKLAKLGHIYLSYDSTTTAFTEVARELVVETPSTPMPKGVYRRSMPTVEN